MATYALLGATRQVGGSILEVLLRSPDTKINAFVRSKRKLLAMRPELESGGSSVTIYEGTLSDIDTLADCITGTSAVFMAIAESDNVPYCDIARQQAKSVVGALNQIRKRDSQVRLPQLIVLSSASLEPYLCKDLPPLGQAIIQRAASYIYEDLRLAEQFLRSHDWIKQVYIKPGGLAHDKPRGHVLSTERQESFLTFLDLAAGMVEVAESDHDKWDLRNVSVLPASPGTKFPLYVPWFVAKGLLYHYAPFVYPYLKGWLP